MIYPSIRIEGAILSPDVLDKIEEQRGQKPSDFGLDSSLKVKDEIARAWADAQDYWRIFQRKLDSVREGTPATGETRQQWITPLLGLLGYQLEHHARGTEVNGRTYTISHRVTNRANAPLHVVGYREEAGLDRKGASARMSAHAVVQEYLNVSDQLYGIVTNGRVLRLLRDSSRLVKQSFLEFDLDRIFTDGLFADFAILYRLMHASRLPQMNESAAESWIERYHQESLDSGARIRDGLSKAVESAIKDFANGFLAHRDNEGLRTLVRDGKLRAGEYYQQQLRLIYRLLFLMVIEERDLVFGRKALKKERDVYRNFYSVQRLRQLSEKRYLADPRKQDLWLSLVATFRLFEANGPGAKLGMEPLAGDLFGPEAIGRLTASSLGNDVLLRCLRSISVYEHPDTRQQIRVNYAALNVEEFGSVYEGLLEYEPQFTNEGTRVAFRFAAGNERARTGSHYTPDELVQPLIRHSLDYLIGERLKAENPETALLSLRVADIACGSGHILLAAARRIATELAVVRTGEEHPSPTAYRTALRDVIRNCIYGVDYNPLAVELCKVALWLEAHIPGQPLNFLDHRVKCGNSIVGFVRREELDCGVPDEAFATMLGDDKKIASDLRKKNKRERKDRETGQHQLGPSVQRRLHDFVAQWDALSARPETTPEEIDSKKQAFTDLANSAEAFALEQVAAIPIAQFYTPKTESHLRNLVTDAEFRRYWEDGRIPQGEGTAHAWAVANERRIFQWFLAFPDVIARGGFDCILGNPPYMGGTYLSGTFGHALCRYLTWRFAPAGLSDLIVFFLRRAFALLNRQGMVALITTNSVIDGDTRKDGLEVIVADGGQLIMAMRAHRWPGRAKVIVSLLSIAKGSFVGQRELDGVPVDFISPMFQPEVDDGAPTPLMQNQGLVAEGSKFLGQGFLLAVGTAAEMIAEDQRNAEVVVPVITGRDLNNVFDQRPVRYIIYFRNWPIDRARSYASPFAWVVENVYPERSLHAEAPLREKWWQFKRPTIDLYDRISLYEHCFVTARVTKHLSWSPAPSDYVFTDKVDVLASDRWDFFCLLQSTLHEVWARKYSGSLKLDLNYTPTECFGTFAFPSTVTGAAVCESLAATGQRYQEHRGDCARRLERGLTDVYNLFHARDLTLGLVQKVSKRGADEAARGYDGILELRRLHRELDLAVRDAYGWQDLDLGHDFHDVETLPENDRTRYTISHTARKEVLRRLLALNHQRAAEEKRAAPDGKRPRKRGAPMDGASLFPLEGAPK